MKKKIIGLFICTLLIVIGFSSLEIVNVVSGTTTDDWHERVKLLASDGVANDYFGRSVSIDGDYAILGAYADDDNGEHSGSAYIFTRSGSVWTEQAKLLPSDGAADDRFGYSVSIDGDTALIGASGDDDNGDWSGSAYIFTRSGSVWTEQAKLLPSDGAADDRFGYSVSIDGDYALVGAFQAFGNELLSGAAYVFIRSDTTWSQQMKLYDSDGATDDRFGGSVSIDGDTSLIGAFGDDDNGDWSGSAYIFTRSGSVWTEQAKLLASDGAADDFFGTSVSINGEYALVGAERDGVMSGSAYIFTRSGSVWTQQAKLLPSDGADHDHFGWSVSIDGDTSLIGAFNHDDNGWKSGSAYIFTRSGSTWTEQAKLLASDGASSDYFGYSVSIDGDTSLIGAFGDDDNGAASGSAYVFIKDVPEPFYFIHITDPHVYGDPYTGSDERWEDVISQMNSWNPAPEFVLCSGDLVEFGWGGGWNYDALEIPLFEEDDVFYIDSSYTIPIYFCPGNHDARYSLPIPPYSFGTYYNRIGPDYYSLKHENCAIFSMNSGVDTWKWGDWWDLSSPEGDGLSNKYSTEVDEMLDDLDDLDDDENGRDDSSYFKIIITHHPYIHSPDDKNYVFWEGRDTFVEACEDYDVDMLFSGHVHNWGTDVNKTGYTWKSGDGTRFIQTPAIADSFLGYRNITVSSTLDVNYPDAFGDGMTVGGGCNALSHSYDSEGNHNGPNDIGGVERMIPYSTYVQERFVNESMGINETHTDISVYRKNDENYSFIFESLSNDTMNFTIRVNLKKGFNSTATYENITMYEGSNATIYANYSIADYIIKIKDPEGYREIEPTSYEGNLPPEKPEPPWGPIELKKDVSYTFNASTIDPDYDDQLYYNFSWGDGSNSGWIGPFESGEICDNATHTWTEELDKYEIKVMAKDVAGCQSEWSEPLEVAVPVRSEFEAISMYVQANEQIYGNDLSIGYYEIVNWTWDFDDGYVSYEQNTSHEYAVDGVYNITLTVSDGQSNTDVYYQIVIVDSFPSQMTNIFDTPDVVGFGFDITVSANITDITSGVDTVKVNITYPDSMTENFTMDNKGNNTYEYVFSDTQLVGQYTYTIWTIDKAEHSNSSSGSFNVSSLFGYTEIGNSSQTVEDMIAGSIFTVNEYGTADNITAFINQIYMSPGPYKCMIYRLNDSKLIGNTSEDWESLHQENPISSSWWAVFNFSEPKPVLEKDTQYVLTCWGDSEYSRLYYDSVSPSASRFDNETYGTPPDPTNFVSLMSKIYSIYCSYTPDTSSPEITNVSDSPDVVGFGFNVNITSDVADNISGIDNVKVNITYPDDSSQEYTMDHTTGDTYEYNFSDTWQKGQYNYTIWAFDNCSNSNSSSGYSFNVSAQCNVSIQTLKDEYVVGDKSVKYVNITDPPDPTPDIGYKLLDDNSVLHMWNTKNDYYFDVNSGVQLTNYYNEYWSHNVLMLGYYNNDEWNLIYRNDELSDFNKEIDTDNETYINVTLWKDLSYQGYEFRLAIRYHLSVYDNDLTVIPYIKNLGQTIPYTLGFGWEINDIKIADTYENDWIRVNDTEYQLDQSLDVQYKDLTHTYQIYNETTNETTSYTVPNPKFILEGRNEGKYFRRTLYLSWDETLDYLLWVKSREGQYNAPVSLFIKIGQLPEGAERSTEMHWLDSDDWLGVSGEQLDSYCEHSGSATLEDALNGTGIWLHNENHVHQFILDLGSSRYITKVRGRSNDFWFLSDSGDPTDVNIYVSETNGNWGDPVKEGIVTWQNTNEWVEEDTVDKNGRYVKVEIIETETAQNYIEWGDLLSPMKIFDVYTSQIESKIDNVGSTDCKGQLIMNVEYNDSGSWILEDNVIDQTETVVNGSPLKLDAIFNNTVNTSNLTNGVGQYRVYVAFCDPVGNVLINDDDSSMNASYEFSLVSDTILPEISGVTLTTSNPLDTIIGWENVTCTVTDNVEVDEVLLNMTVLIYPDTTYSEEFSMNKDDDNYYYNTTFSDVGNYTYYIWANDTSNNTDTSGTGDFSLPPNEDVDMDGQIQFMDLVAIVIMYGDEGPLGWCREDVDNDGQAQFMDLVAIVIKYGDEWYPNETTYEEGNNNISILPSNQTIVINQTFNVSIYVEPTEEINGVSFDYLYFNASLVHANSVTEGNLFDDYLMFNGGTIDNTTGVIRDVYGVAETEHAVTTPGYFCNISFTAQQEIGISDLDLEDVIISNTDSEAVDIMVYDGNVTIQYS